MFYTGSGEYEISIGEERLKTQVKETGSWENFTHHIVGHLPITKAGELTLQIKPIQLHGGGLMNLGSVFLCSNNGSSLPSRES
jgi:hypothetical protein